MLIANVTKSALHHSLIVGWFWRVLNFMNKKKEM